MVSKDKFDEFLRSHKIHISNKKSENPFATERGVFFPIDGDNGMLLKDDELKDIYIHLKEKYPEEFTNKVVIENNGNKKEYLNTTEVLLEIDKVVDGYSHQMTALSNIITHLKIKVDTLENELSKSNKLVNDITSFLNNKNFSDEDNYQKINIAMGKFRIKENIFMVIVLIVQLIIIILFAFK